MSTEKLKLTLGFSFGFLLLFITGALAFTIGLNHVEEKTSFGLLPILGSLSTLSGGFATWAFSQFTKDDKE
jgi:cadmium resistance protein CadD (predicted permease)